ncbi:MAG: hypothetical protein M3298_01150 [Thermoproteota archaeon]|nr:hypothetical protein [Thermoproteota archaeon]
MLRTINATAELTTKVAAQWILENNEPYKSRRPHIEIMGPTSPLMSSSSSFYLCNVCHAIFGNKAELNRHILTHAGNTKGGERIYSERRVPRGSRWW